MTEEDIINTILDFILIAKHRVEQHLPFEEIAGPLGQAEFWLGELQSYRVS